MPLAVAADIKQSLADSMQMASITELGTRWDRIIADALRQGERDIIGGFVLSGYSRDQILASNDLFSFHLMQSLYWTFVRGVGMHNADDRWISKLDHRKMFADNNAILDEVAGVVDAGGTSSFLEAGQMSTKGDRWTRDTVL